MEDAVKQDDSSAKETCGTSCCQVEAVISIDARGQMVLPKELREKVGIRAGDKLVITSWEKDGTVCCLSLTKAEALAGSMRELLGPMRGDTS